MKKLLNAVLVIAAALAGLGVGQQPPVTRRVEIVMEGRTSRIQPQVSGLRDGLVELKYVEGANLLLNLLQEDAGDRLRSKLAAQIRAHKVDAIVALGISETAIAKELTQTIPIVFLPAADPVRSGFVRSLARSDTNLTGLTFFTDVENVGKQLEVFKEVVPALRRIVAISDGRQPSTADPRRQKLNHVASRLGIELSEHPVRSVAEATKIAGNLRDKAGAGLLIVCSGLFRELTALASEAMRHRLPLFGCNGFQVAEQQVLLTYTPDLYSIGYRGAWFVDRLLKGALPQDLPVEMPSKFDLVINRRVAAEIGVKVPRQMLLLADRVFD